jgi:3-phosphoshikimate 1-carboxyvinyltransferase
VTLGRGRYRIDGNARMRERPIGPLLDALRALGVDATSARGDGRPPIAIDMHGERCAGGGAEIDASQSSQFVSALLMPAALWPRGLRLATRGDAARPFIEMTLALMRQWGARSASDGAEIVVPGGQRYHAQNFIVEPDATAASYFAAAAALVGGTVVIQGLGRQSVQGDACFIDLLARMGAQVEWRDDAVAITGTGRLIGVDAELNAIPDVVPTLAAIAPFASTPTRIRKVAFIRHHESDRIAALATELRRAGATVVEFEDGLEIQPSPLRHATIETYDDHRIAMAFAVAGLKAEGVRIRNPGCVAKTWPEFFDDLERLRR